MISFVSRAALAASPLWPASASVIAGSTTLSALISVVVRASVIASRSPTRRLAIAVATPTMATATVPATANCSTARATNHLPAVRIAPGYGRSAGRDWPEHRIRQLIAAR